MYAVTVALALMLACVYIALFTSPARPDRRTESLIGVSIVTLMAVLGLALYWLAYLGHQRSVEARDGQLHVRSWLRWRRFGTDRSFDLSTIERALLLRPHHVELAIPGASTRVGSFYMTLRDVDRFGTFWWYEDDYHALRAVLLAEGIEAEYRHIPGIGTLLSAR